MESQPPSSVAGSRLRRGVVVAGVTLDEIVVRGERIHAWRGHRSDGTQVTVHALVDDAKPREVDNFLEAARKLAALSRTRPIVGLVDVILVAVGDRLYVGRGSVAGTMNDLTILGWGLRDTLTFVRRLCRAMREVHRHGLVHGCATPANVMLDDNLDPRLTDVGAIVIDDSYEGPSDMRHDYALYAAREVRQGERPSVRSDVYSLGRLIANALTGEHPGEDNAVVPRLAQLDHHPPGLGRIVRRATLRDPAGRYGSVDELMADLERYEDKDRVGVAHDLAREEERLSTPPSWRPSAHDAPRRGASTPREIPRRGSGTPEQIVRRGSATPQQTQQIGRRGSATPQELPRRDATTPGAPSSQRTTSGAELPRRVAATPRDIPRRDAATPSAAPRWRAHHSMAPPPEDDDVFTPRQARTGAAAGSLILLISLGFSFMAAISSTLAVVGASIGAAGLSLLIPALGTPWLSRILTAVVLVAATWALDPIEAVALAGRRAKLENGSPIERGRQLALLRGRGLRDFSEIDLSGADFTSLDLSATRFDAANLRAARFDRSRLAGAIIQNADLTAADFSGADLTGVDVAGATGWLETHCDHATIMPDGWHCDDGAPKRTSPLEAP
jgi:hypothetical protein